MPNIEGLTTALSTHTPERGWWATGEDGRDGNWPVGHGLTNTMRCLTIGEPRETLSSSCFTSPAAKRKETSGLTRRAMWQWPFCTVCLRNTSTTEPRPCLAFGDVTSKTSPMTYRQQELVLGVKLVISWKPFSVTLQILHRYCPSGKCVKNPP